MKPRLAGLAIGVVSGLIAGGISAAVYGVPFDGSRGPDAFAKGLVFPGVVWAVPGALAGAILAAATKLCIDLWRKYR